MDIKLKGRIFRSFSFRLILTFFQSAALALAVAGGLGFAASMFYRAFARDHDSLHLIRMLITQTIGDVYAFLTVFFLFFFLFLILLARKYSKAMDAITAGITQIAEGDFDVSVKVFARDEFGKLAQNVNTAAFKLKAATESGEFAKSSKDRLIVNVAHDLKTPLTSINGYLGLILNNDLPPEKVRHYAMIAHAKAESMQKLVDELFAFTRFNFGGTEINISRVDLTFLSAQLLEEFYPLFSEFNLTGRLISPDAHIIINADGDLIARALTNLIQNAVRYGHDGVYVDIVLTVDKSAWIKVVNYDSLIPETEREKIFETFYRAEKSRKSEPGGGSGLGLAIVKSIAEAHGGAVYCVSNAEKTEFVMELPIVAEIQNHKN